MSDNQGRSARDIAGEIVASYVSNNQMPADQVPTFINQIMTALGEGAAPEAEPATEPQKPAVSIRRSVREDVVVCLECGAEQKTLKRHLETAHGVTEADYRSKWNLPKDHPIVAPAYSKARSSMARQIGLGQRGAASRKNKQRKVGRDESD